jgi:hypothetical protein
MHENDRNSIVRCARVPRKRRQATGKKSFTTEITETRAQSSQRRETLLTQPAAKLFVAVAGHGVVVYHAGGLH